MNNLTKSIIGLSTVVFVTIPALASAAWVPKQMWREGMYAESTQTYTVRLDAGWDFIRATGDGRGDLDMPCDWLASNSGPTRSPMTVLA